MRGKLGFNVIAADNSKWFSLHLSICKPARKTVVKQNSARSNLVFMKPHADK